MHQATARGFSLQPHFERMGKRGGGALAPVSKHKALKATDELDLHPGAQPWVDRMVAAAEFST